MNEIADPPRSREDIIALAQIAAFAADRGQLFIEAAMRLVATMLDVKIEKRSK